MTTVLIPKYIFSDQVVPLYLSHSTMILLKFQTELLQLMAAQIRLSLRRPTTLRAAITTLYVIQRRYDEISFPPILNFGRPLVYIEFAISISFDEFRKEQFSLTISLTSTSISLLRKFRQ